MVPFVGLETGRSDASPNSEPGHQARRAHTGGGGRSGAAPPGEGHKSRRSDGDGEDERQYQSHPCAGPLRGMDERSVCVIPRLRCASFDRLGNAGCGGVRGPRAFAAHVFKAAERIVGGASHTARG